jgi:hypothetical protein
MNYVSYNGKVYCVLEHYTRIWGRLAHSLHLGI